MANTKVISWVYVRGLNLSFRWRQGEDRQLVYQGYWRNGHEDLPLVERVQTVGTWTDDQQIFMEINRYLSRTHPDWLKDHGPVGPNRAVSDPPDDESAKSSRPNFAQHVPGMRSTDFVPSRWRPGVPPGHHPHAGWS